MTTLFYAIVVIGIIVGTFHAVHAIVGTFAAAYHAIRRHVVIRRTRTSMSVRVFHVRVRVERVLPRVTVSPEYRRGYMHGRIAERTERIDRLTYDDPASSFDVDAFADTFGRPSDMDDIRRI